VWSPSFSASLRQVWHTTMLSKTTPDSSLLTQHADPSNGALQCSQIQPIYYISLSDTLPGKYQSLRSARPNRFNGSWSLVCRWFGRKCGSFSAAQKKFLYLWRQLSPEACLASLLSISSNCVSMLRPTYFRTVVWRRIRASEKRMLPYHPRWDHFH
jgi:hypothetical protein